MAISAIPILPVESISGNQFRAQRLIEEATQTFLAGTVVTISADGGISAWGGATVSGAIGSPVGISYEAASSLATTGKGAPTPFSPLTGIGAAVGLFGSVQNEPLAVNISHGAPLNDGRVGFIIAATDVIFSGVYGTTGNPTTPTNAIVGTLAGLTIDTAAKYWYVDAGKTTMVKIIGLDPRDVPAAGTRVLFQFLSTAVYLLG